MFLALSERGKGFLFYGARESVEKRRGIKGGRMGAEIKLRGLKRGGMKERERGGREQDRRSRYISIRRPTRGLATQRTRTSRTRKVGQAKGGINISSTHIIDTRHAYTQHVLDMAIARTTLSTRYI